jgi:hypothetical protein
MDEFVQRQQAAHRRRRRRWRIGLGLLGLGLLVYGLPRLAIAIGDAELEDFDFSAYGEDFALELEPIDTWYQLGRISPLTWELAALRRAELRAAAGRAIYLDGMRHRSRRHFEAAWAYFERAAAIHAYQNLVAYFAGLAENQGQSARVLALAERYPQYAPAFDYELRSSRLHQGRFAPAGEQLLAACRRTGDDFDCQRATRALIAAGRNESAMAAARAWVAAVDTEVAAAEGTQDAPEAAAAAEPELDLPELPGPPGSERRPQAERLRQRMSARLLLARLLAAAGRHDEALQRFAAVQAAAEPRTWPLALLGRADALRAAGRAAEARALLLDSAGDSEQRARRGHLPGIGWELLALRRARLELAAGRPQRARALLAAHYDTLPEWRRLTGSRFQRPSFLFDFRAVLPEDELEAAFAALAGGDDPLLAEVRGRVGLLRCRSRLAAFDAAASRACLEEVAPLVAPQAAAGLAFWTEAAAGDWRAAARHCGDAIEQRKAKRWPVARCLVAELRLGRPARALEAFAAYGRDPWNWLRPPALRRLLAGLVALDRGRARPADFPEPPAEQLRTAAVLPRIEQAMAALARGRPRRAVRALGRQSLHYHIYLLRQWVPLARALMLQADPSGRELAFVLQADSHSMAGTLFVQQPSLLWLLHDIAALQDDDAAAATRRSLARQRRGLLRLRALDWGL